jgi:hypothetical protein
LISGEQIDPLGRRLPTSSPRTLTLVINNRCNLACRHCYLQVDKLADAELSLEEWGLVAKRMASAGKTDAVSVAGKEVFLGEKGISILETLSTAFHSVPSAPRLGLISNGTLAHRWLDRILSLKLDFFDISIDGDEPEHDANRGRGAFAAMAANLPPLKNRFGDRLFANFTLQKQNLSAVDRAFRKFSALGFSTVGVGFYQPQPYTDPSLALAAEDFERFFSTLRALAKAPFDRPVTLLMELDLMNFRAQQAFLRSGWFQPAAVFEDSRGDLIQELRFPNGLIYQFRLDFWPSLVSRSARLTPEGLYLAAEDTLNTRLYPLATLGSIRDFDGDILGMHQAACHHPRLQAVWTDYLKREWPLLRASLLESGAIDEAASVAAIQPKNYNPRLQGANV